MFSRIENSPEFEASMERRRKEREREDAATKSSLKKLLDSGKGKTWTPMDEMPFAALSNYGAPRLLVTDGTTVTVAEVRGRFGTPVFYKKQPEYVMRDGVMYLEGGIEDKREDLPKWWWKWEMKDQLEDDDYMRGESVGKPEVDFVATHWMLFPEPPK